MESGLLKTKTTFSEHRDQFWGGYVDWRSFIMIEYCNKKWDIFFQYLLSTVYGDQLRNLSKALQ